MGASFFFFGAPSGSVGGGVLDARSAIVAGEGALGPLPVGAVIGILQAQSASISGQGVAITIRYLGRQISNFGLRDVPPRSGVGTFPTRGQDFLSAFQYQPPAFQLDAFQILSLGETSSRARVAVSEG